MRPPQVAVESVSVSVSLSVAEVVAAVAALGLWHQALKTALAVLVSVVLKFLTAVAAAADLMVVVQGRFESWTVAVRLALIRPLWRGLCQCHEGWEYSGGQ